MNYGINYMGSKNTIASDIVQYIISSHPDKKYFVDACCGGFAVSHYVIKETNMEVYANDLNPYIIDLLEELFFRGAVNFDTVKDKWIPRLKYLDAQNNPDKYPKWFVGYALSNWSFGGRGDSYLYAEDKEPSKRALFDAITKNIWAEELLPIREQIPSYLLDVFSNPNKRKALLLYCKHHFDEQVQLENLTRLERLLDMKNDVCKIPSRVHLSVNDYRDFISTLPKEVLNNAVIYIDPPYEDTAGYYTNEIDYQVFWEFVESLNGVAPVYVSSYSAPERFNTVWSVKKKVAFDSNTMGGTKKIVRGHKIEKLFYNGYANKTELFYDLIKPK